MMSVAKSRCALCRSELAEFEPPTGDRLKITCLRCGTYSIDGSTEAILASGQNLNVGAVSGWVRRKNMMGATPTINDADKMRALTKPPFKERVEQYLLAFANR